MQQKFNLEAAGRLLGISSSAMRARAKKNPEKYRLERDNRGQIWVWIDPENLAALKPALQPALKPSNALPMQALSDELKAAILAIRDHAQSVISADLQAQIEALRGDLAKAEQRIAVAEAERGSAQVLADERARALEAARRHIADLQQMLPDSSVAPSVAPSARPWWRFWP